MPIIASTPAGQTGAGRLIAAADARRQSFTREAARLIEPEAPPTWVRVFEDGIATSIQQGLSDFTLRPRGTDPVFNPFEYIQQAPSLRDDPMVAELVRTGQFDSSRTIEQFDFDLDAGQRYVKAMDRLSQKSWAQFAAVNSVLIAGDPTNLVPIGASATAARGIVGVARRIAQGAAAGGAATLAVKRLEAGLMPASDEPGLEDDALAAALGVTLGGAIGFIAPHAGDALSSAMRQGRSHAANIRLRRLLTEGVKPPRSSRTGDELGGIGPATPRRFIVTLDSLKDDYAMHGRHLDELLELNPEKFADIEVIGVLHRKGHISDEAIEKIRRNTKHPRPAAERIEEAELLAGDDNGRKLGLLLQRTRDSGKRVNLVEAEDQVYYNLFRDLEDIVDQADLARDATPDDLGHNRIDRIVGAGTRRFVGFVDAVSGKLGGGTPVSMLSNAAMGKLAAAARTLSPSLQTIERANATALGNQAGAPAGAVKAILDTSTERLIRDTDDIFFQARRSGQIKIQIGNPITNRREFGAEVMEYRRQQSDIDNGLVGASPFEFDPAVVKAAGKVGAYFRDIRDRMERAGMLDVGPRKVADLERQVIDNFTALNQARRAARRRQSDAVDAYRAASEIPFDGANAFRRSDIRGRLKSYQQFIDEVDPGAVRTAQDQLDALNQDGTLSRNIGDQLTIDPDELADFTPAQRDKLERMGVAIGEDFAAEQRDILGSIYDRAINEAKKLATDRGATRRTFAEHLDDILSNPAAHDPDRVLDAAIYDHLRGLSPAERARAQDFVLVDSDQFGDGMTFSAMGMPASVERIDDALEVTIGNWTFDVDELSAIPMDANHANLYGVEFRSNVKRAPRPALVGMRRQVERLERRGARLNDQLADAKAAVKQQELYGTRVYDLQKIADDPRGFVDDLAAGMRRGWDAAHNDAPPVRAEIALRLPQDELVEAIRLRRGLSLEEVADITPPKTPADPSARDIDKLQSFLNDLEVEDLPPLLRDVYEAELDAFYRRTAESVRDKLLDRNQGGHGTTAGFGGDPVARRALAVPETSVSRWVVQDLEEVMHRFGRAVNGRLAVREAIKSRPDLWSDATVPDRNARGGRRPIETGSDLVAHLQEITDKLRDTGAAAKDDAVIQLADRSRRIIDRQLKLPLDLLEGRSIGNRLVDSDAGRFFGNAGLLLNSLNKLGGVAIAQAVEIASVGTLGLMNPRAIRALPKALLNATTLNKAEKETFGFTLSAIQRQRQLADYIDAPGARDGFGSGRTRQISGRIARGLTQTGNLFFDLTGLNWSTAFLRRFAGDLELAEMTKNARRLYTARDALHDAGDNTKRQDGALRQAGLSRFSASRLNKLGVNTDNAERFVRLTYEHGVFTDGRRVKDVLAFDQYLRTKRTIQPMWDTWPARTDADREFVDVLRANLTAAVRFGRVVDPADPFAKPLISQTMLGRFYNAFQSFSSAMVPQRLRLIAQSPAHHQLTEIAGYVMLGAMSDAIANDLSGRRSLEKSARLWQTDTAGMVYQAVLRSGLAGYMQRPLGLTDGMNLPFSPGVMLGNTVGSRAAQQPQFQYRTPGAGQLLTSLLPPAADADRAGRVFSDLLAGQGDNYTAYNAFKLLPFQNWIALRLLHRLSGLPTTPESITGVDATRQERQPAP